MKSTFWTREGRYGVLHQSEREGRPGTLGALIVFVHGIFGDCKGTWGRMPDWVLDHSGTDVDVVSFAYPSKLWHRTSIPQAADDLRTWLETELGDYRHLLFITHSTGGLVVKQMLKCAFQDLEAALKDGSFQFSSSSSVWLRTRRVINIAVPHHGGSPFLTGAAKAAYAVIYAFLAPFLKLTRFLSQGACDWGYNDILVALRWHNPWLLALEADFSAHQKAASAADLLCPLTSDIYAKSDLSVPISTDPKQRDIYFRGTHGSVKVPTQASDPIITIVAGVLCRYGAAIALQVTERSLARIAEVNKVTGTHSLIDDILDGDPVDRASPTVKAATNGTQAGVCHLVTERARAPSERPRQIVVTGAAGVGKSSVLRMIAGRLGRSYLGRLNDDEPLPLLVPLQQVTLAGDVTYSWKLLWQWWAQWAKTLYPDLAWNAEEWLEQRFRKQATTVILDGLDDFLVNHPTIGLPSVVNLLRDALNQYADNPRLSVIVGIRSGFHGLMRLATDPKDVYEVLRLSPSQAVQAFPACSSWLPGIRDPELRDLVLTPLILSNYEPAGELAARSLTQAAIMDQTMRTILRRSNLVGIRTLDGQTAEIDALIHALTLIAWLFFYRHRGEIDTEALREEAGIVRASWERFFQEKRIARDGQDLLTGSRLVEDAATCHALLARTVFVSTGPHTMRFTHRSWQEFLLAQYFAECLKWGHVEDFGVTAFNSHIYRMAGECFRDATLTEDRVRAVLESWKQSHNTYISGNLIAFLAWTRTAIDPRALRLLLEELPHFEALSRVVLIAGLGYRVLVNDKDDLSLADMRRALLPKLRVFSNPATAPVDDPVACSLAWCYQKAFSGLFGTPEPDIPWPGIGFDDSETLKALPMICTVRGGELALDARSRSLQLAFLVPVLDAYHDPKLAIRALHYLYYLVVARKHGVHVFELSQELPQILSAGGTFERVIDSFSLVPELCELYRRCHAAHGRLESGSP